MKCIKSIKSSKSIEIGTIKRVNDHEAESEVKGGGWKYVPKSENKKMKISENSKIRDQHPVNIESSKEFNEVNSKKNKSHKK